MTCVVKIARHVCHSYKDFLSWSRSLVENGNFDGGERGEVWWRVVLEVCNGRVQVVIVKESGECEL